MFQFIQGDISKDPRGQIRYINDFDMKDVKRFYLIKNSDLDLIRGWRGHRIEQRWFYVLSGSFILSLVKIDDWNNPSKELEVEEIALNSKENRIIYLPPGYAMAFKATVEESELLVFADHYLEHAKFDDYTYDLDFFVKFNRK